MIIYEMVLMNVGKISSPTLEWSNNPGDIAIAWKKCRDPNKTLLKMENGFKRIINFADMPVRTAEIRSKRRRR
jgi:hypothetical protein